MAHRLHIVIASTRPSRKGPAVANWFFECARAHKESIGFDPVLIDLAEFGLPLLDEPEHPRRRDYQNETTKKWAASVLKADAFVFVHPEYNFTLPPSLLNAFDYLFFEWHYTPVGFVSYGGVSGGLRAMQSAKLLVTSMKMMPMAESVPIPFFVNHIQDGKFIPEEIHKNGAAAMLKELHNWTDALHPMREKLRDSLKPKEATPAPAPGRAAA